MVVFSNTERKEAKVIKYGTLFERNAVFCLTIYDILSFHVWFEELRAKGFKVLRTNSKFVSRSLNRVFGRSIGSSSVCVSKLIDIHSYREFLEFYRSTSEVLGRLTETGFDLIFFALNGRIYDGSKFNKIVSGLKSPVICLHNIYTPLFCLFKSYNLLLMRLFFVFDISLKVNVNNNFLI